MHTFALIGAAGYVAPRHMLAIRDVGGELKAAVDPSDSVGVLDRYFPVTNFFVEFERFDQHLDMLRQAGDAINYVSICSPNHLHDAHVRFALRSDADAICEKPLVLDPWTLDGLEEMELCTGRHVSTILQLRLNPAVVELKRKVDACTDRIFDVDLTYITFRGPWYGASWKGDSEKSGGVETNIGIHFFDMLHYIFGPNTKNIVHLREEDRMAGYQEYEKARVRWFLSIRADDLPTDLPKTQTTYRVLTLNGDNIEISGRFDDLHTRSYEEIIAGRGFGIDTVRPSIEMVSQIRETQVSSNQGEKHPLVGRTQFRQAAGE